MIKKEAQKLLDGIIHQARSQHPNDAVIGQREVLSVLADEGAVLMHSLKQTLKQIDSFPPGRNKEQRGLESL